MSPHVALLLLLLPVEYLQGLQGATIEGGRPALILAGSVVAILSLVDIGLAVAVFFGRNWARIWLMLSCVLTTTTAFIGDVRRSEAVTLATTLPTVGLSILVLLALSSHRARAYAERGRHIRKRVARSTMASSVPGIDDAASKGSGFEERQLR